MEELDHTVKEALETMLAFEGSFDEVELKTGELFHLFEARGIDPEPLYQIFRVFSEIRFHMAEAHEYRSLLDSRLKKLCAQKKKAPGRSAPEEAQCRPPQPAPPPQQPAANRMEGRLVSLLITP